MWSTEILLMTGSLLVLIFFNFHMFARVAFPKPGPGPDRDLPVSVVICARNESYTLKQVIPLMMEQDHREFELVIVNDRSDDDTWEVLQWMKPQFPKLRIVNVSADEKFSYGKKIALGIGVRAAKHPNILLTDADCLPASKDWISLMATGFRNGKKIVIGNSPYAAQFGLTNILERFDGAQKSMQYMGFALAGMPYMGVGRNLGYGNAIFFSAKGPRRHDHLMSGDDDLRINELARANNTSVITHPGSFMITSPTPDLVTWIRRKRRHYTTAVHYRFIHQVLLMLFPFARMVFWVTVVLLAIKGEWLAMAIGLAIKLGVLLPINMIALHKLKAGVVTWLALPLEWLFLLLDPMLYASTLLVKPKRWK
ncbi:MAG: glycosyltransferase [Bacteroidota bacterium]|nr:glycosyltransferase [Bacteroidota bacterium]